MSGHVTMLKSGAQGFANAVERLAVKDKKFAEELVYMHGIRSEITPNALKGITKDMFDKAGKLTKNGKSIQFVFEAIRREQDWKKKLIDKMILYKDFYENFVPGDSGFSGMPQLILICEDEKHMAEAFKEIVTNQVEIPQIKLYFTTDLRQNEETLENTLVEFKLENGKYKKENVELKLLGM